MAKVFINPFDQDDDRIRKFTIEAYYQGKQPNYTNDGLWAEDELIENLQDECYKVVDKWKKLNMYVAIFNEDLLHDNILFEQIKEMRNVIDVYNEVSSKDRTKFGIAMYDKWIWDTATKILDNNKVVK